jgi:cell division protein FtsL
MKKIILNYYLLAILLVIAQAIFVVAQGNSSITYIKRISTAEKQQTQLEQKLSILESELDHLQSIENTR